MTIKKAEQLEAETVFYIYEPKKYGGPDASRKVKVPHSLEECSKLKTITQEEIDDLPDDRDYKMEAEIFEVPEVGTVVFINDFDTDYCSALYRKGAHDTKGPYLLVK